MAEAEVTALKEALYKQAQFIQELSAELEEERKAAASGTDEALSMIFRLQEERAMEKMEASQYKRMAEAKLIHADESLAFLKEAILEKEIEIAGLRFQVESYRKNMLRIGRSNTDVEETKTFETPGLNGNNTFLNVSGSNERFRRHISMPTSWFHSLNLDMNIIDKNGPLIPTMPTIWSEIGECSKQLKPGSEFLPNKSIIEEVASSSELQEIKEDLSLKLNNEESVIPMPVAAAADDESQSNMRTDSFYVGGDSRKRTNLFNTRLGSIQIKSKCSYCSCLPSQRYRSEHDSFSSFLEKDSTRETFHSTDIQDIYEIPNGNYGDTANESCKLGSCKTALEAKQKAVEGSLGDDLLNRKPMKCPAIGKGVSMNSLHTCDEITVCKIDVEELKLRVQKLENDQWIMKEEESKMLKQIHEQLNIQSQTKVSKHKQLSRQDEILLSSVTEAILSFAL